ncbi:MAG: hypothetical protein AAB608_01265, partial [Patescibacteria group bacterium]
MTFEYMVGGAEIGIGTTTPVALLDVTASAGYYTAGDLFRVASGSPDAVHFIVKKSGNVGIGTDTPGTDLDVYGNASISGNFEITGKLFARSTASVSSNFEVGTSTFFVNTTSTNVGIGNVTPNEKLDVTGNILASTSATTQNIMLHAASTTGNGTGTDGLYYLRANTGATTADRFDILNGAATALFTVASGGNVSIGTTTPTAAFEVNDTAAATDPYILVADGTNKAAELGDGGGGTHGYGYLRLMTNGVAATYLSGGYTGAGNASISYINAGGANVGIGTKTPEANLDVTGNILASSSATTVNVILNAHSQTGNGTGYDGRWYLRANTGATTADRFSILNGAATEVFTIASNGYVGIGTTAPTADLEVKATTQSKMAVRAANGIGAELGIDRADGTAGGYLRLMTNSLSTTYLTGYSASNSYISAGQFGTNLGIGTKTPDQKLDVNGNILASTSAATQDIILHAAAQTANGTGYDGRWYLRANTGATTADRFGIMNGAGTEFFSIASSGNVGIGTTAPTTKLDVIGNASVSGNLEVTGTIDGPYTLGSVLFSGTNGVISQDNASFFWDDTNNRLGIGTTTPNAQLALYGGANAGGVYVNNSNGRSAEFGSDMTSGTAAGYLRLMTNSLSTTYLTGYSASNSYISVGQFGTNLGIGTKTPDQKLDVNGNILASTSATTQDIRLHAASQTSNGTGTDGLWYLRANTGATTADRFSILNGAATEVFTIASNGYVGIGTSTPTANLEVRAATQSKIAVRANNGMGAELGIDRVDGTAGGYLRLMTNSLSATTYLTGYSASNSYINAGQFGTNLGIGTRTPDQKLDVNGNILASTSAAIQYITLNAASQTSNGSGYDGRWHLVTQTGAGALDRFSILNNANTEVFAIASNGNIGIGTTAPSSVFNINLPLQGFLGIGQSTTRGVELGTDYPGGAPTGYLRLGYQLNLGSAYTNTYFSGYTTSASYVNANGANLGIGTRTPDQKLDVTGNILASTSAATTDLIL